jgi:hypothetical protein
MASKNSKPKSPEEAPDIDPRGHRQGSRKSKVRELHDKQGPDAAWVLGKKLGLKEGTLRTWFGHWRHATGKSAKPSKIATKSAEGTQATIQ